MLWFILQFSNTNSDQYSNFVNNPTQLKVVDTKNNLSIYDTTLATIARISPFSFLTDLRSQ